MFTISSIFLLIIVSFCHGQSTNRECTSDAIDFATKVEKSSVVVYGKAMAKIMNEGSDSIFHVFYQVDCVLKGPATLRQINITNAGRVEAKKYCQEFPVGRGYSIAFLEPVLLNNKTDYKTYTPADFAEILDEGNSTSQLLARTCNLHRLVPRQSLASVSEVCPPVGTHPICLEMVNSTAAIVATNIFINASNIIVSNKTTDTLIKTSTIANDKAQLTHLNQTEQQGVDIIRGKSGLTQIDVDRQNSAQTITFSIFLMIMAIFFCLN